MAEARASRIPRALEHRVPRQRLLPRNFQGRRRHIAALVRGTFPASRSCGSAVGPDLRAAGGGLSSVVVFFRSLPVLAAVAASAGLVFICKLNLHDLDNRI